MRSTFGVVYFLVLAVLTSQAKHEASACAGCLDLDDLTFDRIVAKFRTVLVKFDVQFPFGNDHDAFAVFARGISELKTNNVIAATVGKTDQSKALFAKYRDESSLPSIKLILNNDPNTWLNYPIGKSHRHFSFCFFFAHFIGHMWLERL